MLTSSEIADYFFWYSDYNTPESDLVYNIVSNSRKKNHVLQVVFVLQRMDF